MAYGINRTEIWARDQWQCVYCGKDCSHRSAAIHADHIVPTSKGGMSVASNMVTSCGSCNQSKGNKTLQDLDNVLNLVARRNEVAAITGDTRVRGATEAARDSEGTKSTRHSSERVKSQTRLTTLRLTDREMRWCRERNGIAAVVRSMIEAEERMAVPLASAHRDDVGLKPMRLKSVSSFDPDADGGAQ